MSIDRDDVKDTLTENDLRRIFCTLGFRGINNKSPNRDGWIGKVHGPPALGEGQKGNFSVNLHHGGVRDHGDEGYSGDLFNAVMDVKHMEFAEALKWVATEAGMDVENATDWKPGEGQVVDVYKYRDASGELRFEQVREAPPAGLDNPKRSKSFYPRVPDKGKGLHGRDKIPYRLPEFAPGVDDRPVYVTYHEGEKDVDNVRALGIPATTTPFGANSFDAETAVPYFEGLHVAVFPDYDEEGDMHAKEVAEALMGTAESVKIVRLPNRPAGGDVSDWIEQQRGDGNDDQAIANALRAHIKNAQTFAPTSNGTHDGGAVGFWYVDQAKERIRIDRAGLLEFLTHHGYGKLYAEDDLSSTLVRINDQVVSRTSLERVKDHVRAYVSDLGDDATPEGYTPTDIMRAVLKGANVYFSENLFEFMDPLDVEFKRDTADTSFFYYENGFVEVTADGFELRPYSELDGVIWKDQIINREFKPMLGDSGVLESDWHRFIQNVSGGDRARKDALETAIGYLLHGYKDPACAKAVILVDEAVSDVPNGRTGKSIVAESLRKLVPAVRIDARNFSFDQRFSFQSVRLGHRIIDFNDAPRKFDFERLFSVITDDMQVERKGRDEVTIPFEESPKFILTTNYIIEGEGSSFEDRVFQVEFGSHYGADRKPVDDFGTRFFDGWTDEQWHRFDNLMLAFVRSYLRSGLKRYRHKNLELRKLRQETSVDFADWIQEKESKWYDKAALHRSFREAYEGDYEWLTQRKFTRWCNRYGRIYTGDKLPTKKSGADRFIKLPDLDDE